jgi:hypothetical protein
MPEERNKIDLWLQFVAFTADELAAELETMGDASLFYYKARLLNCPTNLTAKELIKKIDRLLGIVRS